MDINRSIPFFSAKAVNAEFDLQGAVARVIARGRYVMDQEVAGFELEFAQYIGTRHCIALANGTDAIVLSLRAAGIGPGDLVALVANAGFYGSAAVHLVGATPVYVDVDQNTLTMSPKKLTSALKHQPKAVIVTHLYGQMAEIKSISEICRSNQITLIEDCAQSHGALRDGKRAGNFGDMAAFSFYPTKNLGALGDGGAVTCNDNILAQRLRALMQYGWSSKYTVSVPKGCNSRLDEVQAAVLRAKLPQLDSQNSKRRQIAKRYNEAFCKLPLLCPDRVDEDYVGHLYVVQTACRDEMRNFLALNGVNSEIHYPIADHLQTAYLNANSSFEALPVTEAACNSVLSLPCHPGMDGFEIERVVDVVLDFHASMKESVC